MRIVFDLDGTLIDSAPDIHAAGNAVLAAEGMPSVDFETAWRFVGRGAANFVRQLEHAAAGENDPDRTERMRLRFLAEYETAHALTTIYPGVEEALKTLAGAGWRLGLCTNKPYAPARSVLAHFGWADRFETVLCGDSLPVMKPDPAPLWAAFEPLGDGPMVYVGDSETDAETARAAGVPFALFTRGYRKTPVTDMHHDRAFDDWADLPGIARALIG
jgi:phosphoglycolate phosphatase